MGLATFVAFTLTGTVFLIGDLLLDLEALEGVCLPDGFGLTAFAVLVGESLRPEADLSGRVLFAAFLAGLVVLDGDFDFAGDFARVFCILSVLNS